MHIHRNECAETTAMVDTQNLYTFRANAIQGLFSTLERA